MDFLALRNLTVIKDALDRIEENHGVKLNMSELDMSDPAVYELLSERKDRRRVPVGKCRYEVFHEAVEAEESG